MAPSCLKSGFSVCPSCLTQSSSLWTSTKYAICKGNVAQIVNRILDNQPCLPIQRAWHVSITSCLVRASSHHHQCLIYRILYFTFVLPLQVAINLSTDRDEIAYISNSPDPAKTGPILGGVVLLFYHYIIVIRIPNSPSRAIVLECSFLLNYTNSV